jgi:ribonuclease P protein component
VLDRRHRLTSSAGFSSATRRGRRAGSGTLVVHLLQHPVLEHGDSSTAPVAAEPRVGLVVARSVGNAVTRNRVRRRLRHLARERLASLPAGSVLVVRALPAAAAASYDGLGRDLDSALRRARRPGATDGATGRRR